MMKFEEHPDHNRYISVSFDDNRRHLPMQMGIQVNYLMEDTGWDALRKAIRLDNEVMHLLKAAPAMLEALKSLFENCAMIHKHWGENDNNREADAAIAAAHAAIAAASKTTY